jgi:beta-glucosidase-like glycosyl hydrolase
VFPNKFWFQDPYVVGTIATEYVKGIQSEGPVATLKHFVGYSNSRAGRNLAPVHAGPRELQDVLLIPFEMAVLDGGVDSVMNSYAEVDGMPVAADASILTTLLREKWGFTGTVVADYFAIAFLQTLHGVAGSPGDAGAQALFAGIDVELPTGVTYLQPLAEAIRAGKVKEELVDRALRRVLLQKERLGLLAKDYDPAAPLKNLNADGIMDLDPLEHREIARELAEESIVLLSNKGGALPIDPKNACKIAVIGPNAHDTSALFGCYSFANHVLAQHPHLPVWHFSIRACGFKLNVCVFADRPQYGQRARLDEEGVRQRRDQLRQGT